LRSLKGKEGDLKKVPDTFFWLFSGERVFCTQVLCVYNKKYYNIKEITLILKYISKLKKLFSIKL
jgi:hypothetical protein